MKILRIFFSSTRIFWIISRLILGFIFGYCAYFLSEDILPDDIYSAAFFLIFSLVIFWNFYSDLFSKGTHKFFKLFTGSVLILMGLVGVYSTSSIFGFSEYPVMLLACLWFLMAGLFDLFSIGKNAKEANGEILINRDLPLDEPQS